MKISCIQMDMEFCQPDRNFEKAKRLIAAVDKCGGRNVLINHRQTGELVKMIISAVAKRGATIQNDVARYLIEYVSEDIETLQNEIEKLCAFKKAGVIDKETVNKVCVKNIEQSVYELGTEILKSNVGGALKILDELLLFRMYAAKNASVSINDVAKTFSYGNRTFLLEKAGKNLGFVSGKQLRLSLSELKRADMALKSFSGSDRIVLEELIVRLSYIIIKGESVDKA